MALTAETASELKASGGSKLGQPTLLVVDDEEGPRNSVRVLFRSEYRVLLSPGGEEAVALALGSPVDVAVVDIRMPGMSGIEVLRRLKEIDPDTQVIILTAYETLETARQALRLGAHDYLSKPFTVAEMRAAVASAVERRLGARQLRQSTERLRALHRELEVLQAHQEWAKQQGDIYGSVLHDLNGPLTIIAGYIALLDTQLGSRSYLEGQGMKQFREVIRTLNGQVANCIDVVQRYLGFLREGRSEPRVLKVNQALADVNNLLQVHPDARDKELVVRPWSVDFEAPMNGVDLIQVLLNLVINALQAGPAPLRVELAAAFEQGPLEPGRRSEGRGRRFVSGAGFAGEGPFVTFTVRDSGAGIPAEAMQKLFHVRFTTKPAPKGSGIGLSIVRRLVLQAGGALEVETELGRGTTFRVLLPCAGLGVVEE